MNQEQVGDLRQPLERVLVAVGDRLVGHVPAGHHQRRTGLGDASGEVRAQQVMKRRIRQHHPELGRTGGDRVGDRRAGQARREHDRALGAEQQLALALAERNERLGRLQAARHQRERLVLPVLAGPQRRHRPLVVGTTGEVIAADALDGDDPAVLQCRRGGCHLVAG